jgi:hypothetical protein
MATKRYTEDQFIEAVQTSETVHQVLQKLGLRKCGGNYDTVRIKARALNVDLSHMTGKSWKANKQIKSWTEYKQAGSVKRQLLKVRGNQCELCRLESWRDRPIVVELHHIDGDRTNNVPENLQLLCPNCHSVTDNWKGKNLSRCG